MPFGIPVKVILVFEVQLLCKAPSALDKTIALPTFYH